MCAGGACHTHSSNTQIHGKKQTNKKPNKMVDESICEGTVPFHYDPVKWPFSSELLLGKAICFNSVQPQVLLHASSSIDMVHPIVCICLPSAYKPGSYNFHSY